MRLRILSWMFAVVVCAAGSPCDSRADLVIVQEITSTAPSPQGEESRLVAYYKGEKARIDIGDHASSIIDGPAGKVITLMHDQKMVMTMDARQTQALAALGVRAAGASGSPAKITPTGRKERINGFDTEEFLFEQEGNTTVLWLARNYPNKENLLKHLAMLQKSEALSFAREINSYGMDKLPGIPVRMITKSGGFQTTVNLVSIQEKNLDDSLFTVPAGYKGLEMPPGFEGLFQPPAGH